MWDKNSSFYTPRSRSNGGEPLLVTRAALRYTARPPFAYLLVALIVGTLDLICCVFLARPSMLRVKAEYVLCTVSLQDAAKRRNWPHRRGKQTRARAAAAPEADTKRQVAAIAALEAAATAAEAAAQAEQVHVDAAVREAELTKPRVQRALPPLRPACAIP